MKKFIFTIIALLSLTLFSCKKHESNSSQVTGIWTRDVNLGYAAFRIIDELHFNDNGDFVQRTYRRAPGSGEIMGYYYKLTGKYRENNGNLEFYDIKQYGDLAASGDNYVDENKLVQKDVQTTQSTAYSLNQGSTVLALGTPCAPNAFCVRPYFVYMKAN